MSSTSSQRTPVRYSRLNPDIGDEADFAALASKLRLREMGILMDVVPNHMCIAGSANRWWNDVLENGPSSPFAAFFDIDWNPPNVVRGGESYVLEARSLALLKLRGRQRTNGEE